MELAERRRITMPCDIESRRPEPDRKAAWHDDCPRPSTCPCLAHERDRRGTGAAR